MSWDHEWHEPSAAATSQKTAFVLVWLSLYFFSFLSNQAVCSGFFPSFPALGEDAAPPASFPPPCVWGVEGRAVTLAGWPCLRGSGPWRGHGVWPHPGLSSPSATASAQAPDPRRPSHAVVTLQEAGAAGPACTAVQGQGATS